MSKKVIFTRDEAAEIVDLFDDLLASKGIKVPSEDDADRDGDNAASLYGMDYWNLVDAVEDILKDLLEKSAAGVPFVENTFSGDR